MTQKDGECCVSNTSQFVLPKTPIHSSERDGGGGGNEIQKTATDFELFCFKWQLFSYNNYNEYFTDVHQI